MQLCSGSIWCDLMTRIEQGRSRAALEMHQSSCVSVLSRLPLFTDCQGPGNEE